MTPDLTDQQRQALHETNNAGPVTVVDPATHTQYVLMRADVFRELLHGTLDLEPADAYPLVDRIMADDDAHDPLLAGYQDEALSREPA
jgi:hypothetical protein